VELKELSMDPSVLVRSNPVPGRASSRRTCFPALIFGVAFGLATGRVHAAEPRDVISSAFVGGGPRVLPRLQAATYEESGTSKILPEKIYIQGFTFLFPFPEEGEAPLIEATLKNGNQVGLRHREGTSITVGELVPGPRSPWAVPVDIALHEGLSASMSKPRYGIPIPVIDIIGGVRWRRTVRTELDLLNSQGAGFTFRLSATDRYRVDSFGDGRWEGPDAFKIVSMTVEPP
jgi:hypothetical protein